jgi:hypothetical protein
MKRGDEQKGKIKRERAKKEKPKGMKNQEKLCRERGLK